MRALPLVLVCAALAAGCDDDKPAGGAASAAPSATAPATATATATATAAPTASATAGKVPMPPRPVPIPSSGPIQPAAPPEQQMMAIAYTIAMTSPQGNDPITVDESYLGEVTKKLEGAVRGIDKGTTPANPVKATKGNRKLEIEMGKGCGDRTPAQLLQRAGSSLGAAHDAGVLVVMCHDDKWECHQSTRDAADVLCLAAPRGKR